MDASRPNALNKGVQGLWATHRKARLNLNSAPPPGSAAGDAILQSVADNMNKSPSRADKSAPRPESTESCANGALPTSGTPTFATVAENPLSDAPTSTKRKTRTEGGVSKRPKTSSSGLLTSKDKDFAHPSVRLADLGGVQSCIEKVLELVAMPISHPEVYVHTGVQPPRGVLLHGPPGCGKTMLANAIAGELEVPFISISAPSIVSGMSGESERSLRGAFDEAQKAAPSILFIDEIDAITPKRESAQREMERRIVAQFLTCMDELSWEKTGNKPVIVIGATNRPDSLDSALRRAGRFDHEISMTVPDEIGREQILRAQCVKLKLTGGFDFRALAKATPGYVGADLSALTGAAGVIAVKRIFRSFGGFDADPPSVNGKDQPGVHTQSPEDIAQASDMQVDEDITSVISSQAGVVAPSTNPISSSISSFLKRHPNPLTPEELEPLTITYDDFLAALTQVQPSSKREGFTTIPDVTWADIGALHSIRDELKMAIVQPIRRPEVFRAVGITASCGVLLWGPPGCGKTLLAKAVANESRANFISVKGPELLNKYVGESERAVRQVFSRAAASAPCVIFFDELDALVPRRDDSLSESSARVVNTLLTELDGLQVRKEVYVIAATNRPDMIDPAMCRPGRLDKLLYVDLPDGDERTDILRTLLRNVPLAPDDSSSLSISASLDAILNIVRQKCDGYSGADLAALVREAGVLALRETLNVLDAAEASGTNVGPSENQLIKVTVDHFERATGKVLPSVSVAQRRKYEALRSKFAGLPMRSRVEREEIPRGSRDDPAL